MKNLNMQPDAGINTAYDASLCLFVTSLIRYFTWKNLSTDLLTVLKKTFSSRGLRPLTPHQGLCSWAPLGASPPESRYRLPLPRSPCVSSTISLHNLKTKLRVWFWCNFTWQCVSLGSVNGIKVGVFDLDLWPCEQKLMAANKICALLWHTV